MDDTPRKSTSSGAKGTSKDQGGDIQDCLRDCDYSGSNEPRPARTPVSDGHCRLDVDGFVCRIARSRRGALVILSATMFAEAVFRIRGVEKVHEAALVVCYMLLFCWSLTMSYAGILG
ncbi:hypothetical protein CH63R_09805 [Colletotrichum higginsianum IMI 349063]|uniref:Uncharacterized protein n=1 Tax=Colletotrichum higginsianum (strain IMI 349063) TaxID=759273 RepID=A0A1B7Y118_COLHI|nr:uncharacterized protein CH63R_09805 [Colletotrichum higginsianum IMI 349063]OBR05685.1 hypothetical protein CH63R_09805 [Colletotrichum higginsianum IMI 349063]